MESTETIENTTGREFWRGHILKARDSSGTAAEYCRKNNLKPGTFYSYRRHLGISSGSLERKRFVRVIQEPNVGKAPEQQPLPDPKWLADFVLGILGGR